MEKILIADDYEDNADVFKLILETEGYQTKVVNTSINILQEVENFQPHLIVLDVQLGNIDGRIIARLIKNSIRLKDIKIILTSAGLDEKKVQQIPTEDYDNFLFKPFDIANFSKSVKSLLS